MRIVVASQNNGKLKEFKSVLEPLGYEVLSARDLGVNLDDVVEDQDTFEGNALIKARYLHEKTGLSVVSDDSGLCLEALPNILGVYSARFMGEDTDYSIKNAEVLRLLEPYDNKNAAFHCVIAIVGDGFESTFSGKIEGLIKPLIGGQGGFGYDPIFFPHNEDGSFATLSLDVKNKISHRAQALQKLHQYLKEEQA